MQRRLVYALALAACLPSCDAPAEVVHGPSDAATDAAQREQDAGVQRDTSVAEPQTPSSQCDVSQCEREANELAQSLMAPAEVPLTVRGGECARVDLDGLAAGLACMCLTSNGWLYIGPEGAGCFARGRAGDCLWDDSEYDACTEGDPACSAMCNELDKRYDADSVKVFDVEVRYSGCQNDACHYVLRIEDACYGDHSFESGRSFDCNLSDEQILAREGSE